MKRTFLACVVFLFLFAPGAIAAEVYEIDPAHSSVIFKIKHLGISTVTGEFGTFEGSITYDESAIEKSTTKAKIVATSIDTRNQKRDNHLRDPDFFDVQKFPEISFVSTGVKKVDGENFQVTGDLTMHGVTKQITLDTEFGGKAVDPWGNERVAFTATAKLNRKDYGLTYSKILETGGLVVGNDVRIILEIEAKKPKA